MTKQTPIKADGWPAEAPKMRAKLRQAIHLIVSDSKSVKDAAAGAGFNPDALSRAINRPEIKAYIEQQRALFSLEADKLKGYAKAVAIHTGIEIMRSGQSEAAKVRLVEFFAGEAKSGSAVNVQVNVDRGGYEFRRPGQRLVDIAPATDVQSSDDAAQGIDDAE